MALQRDPARRYETAQLFARDLERLRRGQRPIARLPNPAQRAAAWVRRHPFASSTMALLSAASVVIVALAADVRSGTAADRARLMAEEAKRIAYEDPDAGLRLAMAARATTTEPVPEALVAIQAALAADQAEYSIEPFARPVADVRFAPDGRLARVSVGRRGGRSRLARRDGRGWQSASHAQRTALGGVWVLPVHA
ncbi:MAG: hypothetical protein KAI24_18590 [Planctomycetes bacterium]|nr:hypothetical protein [Planctomycetota bacterium]